MFYEKYMYVNSVVILCVRYMSILSAVDVDEKC